MVSSSSVFTCGVDIIEMFLLLFKFSRSYQFEYMMKPRFVAHLLVALAEAQQSEMLEVKG